MKVNKIHLLWIGIVLSFANAKAQDYPKKEYSLEKIADDIFPMQDLDLNYEDLYENLSQLLSNPLNLNKATEEDLRSLFILSESQVEDLITYRRDNGDFLSIYELQSIPSFEMPAIYNLIPFVRVQIKESGKKLIQRILSEPNNYLVLRYQRGLEKQDGYSDPDSLHRYAGSPDKLYSRLRISRPQDFSVGFTMEKDPGEDMKWSSKKPGFDYFSGHLQLINKGRIQNVIIGDYQAQFGQGLLLGGGFGMGKGAEAITTIRRSTLGFLPYTSLNESGFFRGAAMTLNLSHRVQASFFFSSLNRDGSLQQDSLENGFISSLLLTGMHRTQTEIQNRKSITELNEGACVEFRNGQFHAGMLYHQTHFGVPIEKDPTPYNQFDFHGDVNRNLSAFANYTIRNVTLFGEGAQTLGHGTGIVIGALGSLSRTLDVSLLYRRYDANFYSFYSNAIAENTFPKNESGIYWGCKYQVARRVTMSGYIDMFKFPWLRFRAYSPGVGTEGLIRFTYKPSKETQFFVQLRSERKVRNTGAVGESYSPTEGTKRNFWVCADYGIEGLSFKTRVQGSSYRHENLSKGFAVVQDIGYDWSRFSVYGRYALFNTDDFDNRQFVYERDVWLAFSFPAYYGTGIRAFLLFKFVLTKKSDIWIRLSRTSYHQAGTIGTAGEAIHGNSKDDIKVQFRISL